MIYPSLLRPTSQESFALPSGPLAIPKAELTLRRWAGAPITNTFGGKALIDFAGRPLFAELCVYELLRLSGWEARWVETYGAPAMRPNHFTAWADDRLGMQQHDPIMEPWVIDSLERIAAANVSSYAGCWDVVGWNGTDLLFAELKRRKQDRVRSTQHRWLEAGLQAGLKPGNFLLVEWDFAD
ncbi:hypothetical protein LGH70_22475 [Hymenobacter sp. BT635]|uniref:VRR-NUC domain-containing protein n=1 Tax=Hymenobacter nitidus TaxID=2880929 RepID=A0ABS8AME3_9BACT|nr:hypothetical protein [Hymenobacter nitidus]MCB2380375.1 hypothetical protein [Hymenobacter nitidus]